MIMSKDFSTPVLTHRLGLQSQRSQSRKCQCSESLSLKCSITRTVRSRKWLGWSHVAILFRNKHRTRKFRFQRQISTNIPRPIRTNSLCRIPLVSQNKQV